MNPKTLARMLATLSLAYGLTVGILATIDTSAMTTVAIIGAVVLGALWMMCGIFLHRDQPAG